MAINVSQAFKRTSANPIDESLALTKAQMKAVNDNLMPVKWFTIGQEDGKIYLYDKSNTVDETTGKFRVFEGGGGGGASAMSDLTDVLLTSLQNGQTLSWNGSKWVNTNMPTVPTKVSQLTNDSGFISSETDPTVPSWAKQSTKPSYTKSEVGLGNVDNTSDANKPVSTPQQIALDAKQAKLQFETLPTASVDYAGKVFEYVGASGNGLTHGYFYECKESNGTYSWVQTNVQPSGGGGGGSYTAGDGIDITDDTISIDPMPAEDVDEVIDVYPTAGELVSIVNAFNKGDLYSTEERMIGQWTDGKPLYQRVFDFGETITIYDDKWTSTGIQSGNINRIVKAFGYAADGGYKTFDCTIINGYINVHSLKTPNDALYGLIIQYTKSTDTAISIGEATEYSTEEKIVGTWITGEPIYQKTIVTTLPAKDVITTVPIGASIENIVDIRTMVVTGTNRSLFQSANALSSQDADTTSFVKIYGHNYLGNNDGNNPNELVLINHIKVSTWDNSPVYVTIQYTKHIST